LKKYLRKKKKKIIIIKLKIYKMEIKRISTPEIIKKNKLEDLKKLKTKTKGKIKHGSINF